MPAAMTKKDLVAENNKLRDRIKELEQREGDVLPTQSSPTKKKAEEPTEGLIFYADGRVASCSPDTAAILGYTPQELMSFSAKTVANHIHPADRPRVQTNMRLRFEGKSTPDRNQYRCLHKNGHLVWLEVSSHFTTYLPEASIDY